MTYTMQDLGPYNGYSDDPVFGLDGATIYAARDRATGGEFDTQAAFWDGSWTVLPDPDEGLTQSVARDGVGDLIVGHIDAPFGSFKARAVLWERMAGQWVPLALPLPQGALGSAAISVTPDGATISGEIDMGDGDLNAAMWVKGPNGIWTTEVLPKVEMRASTVGQLTSADTVYGNRIVLPNFHPTRWSRTPTSWQDSTLPLPSGVPSETVNATLERAKGGWAAGGIGIAGAPFRAMRWTPQDTIEDINAGDNSFATSIQDGDVVGVEIVGNEPRGFHWTPSGGKTDIHIAGQDWSYPGDLNAQGQIVGVAGKRATTTEPASTFIYLLTPSQN